MSKKPSKLQARWRRVSADLETPVSAYLKLCRGERNCFLLESVEGGERWGRYSFIGLSCRYFFKAWGRKVEISGPAGSESRESRDPLAELDDFHRSFDVDPPPGPLPFSGGLVGYLGYETAELIEVEKLGRGSKPDEIGAPDIYFMVPTELVAFDNLHGVMYLITYAENGEKEAAERKLSLMEEKLASSGAGLLEPLRMVEPKTEPAMSPSGFDHPGFIKAVEKILEYVRQGEIIQGLPSQRMVADYRYPEFNIYRALRSLSPSPHLFYLALEEGLSVAGSSPEILIRKQRGKLVMRPIAGTRPRGSSPEEDDELARELAADQKETAEHVMLIDLARNDLTRIAEPGSVRVDKSFELVRYSHVMHIESEVSARARRDTSFSGLIRAVFPAGTVSGAPKVRAMEIIQELEPIKRGIYSGALGYLSWSGDLELALTLRTVVISDGKINMQAGAGIVADSIPEAEWQETLNKRRAMFLALALLEEGKPAEGRRR